MIDNLEQIGEILGAVGSPGCFTARRTATADDLQLEVQGLGRLRLPVSRAQAENLCRLARPARYGRGEKTLLDRRVRDTWEIPRSRVKIDRRRWNRTLLPVAVVAASCTEPATVVPFAGDVSAMGGGGFRTGLLLPRT